LTVQLTNSLMKYNPEGMPGPVVDFAYSVAHLCAIESSLPFNGAEVGCEQNHIASPRSLDDRFRLRSRNLLRHHKFSPGVVRVGLIEQ
jgi:hypothetical protein